MKISFVKFEFFKIIAYAVSEIGVRIKHKCHHVSYGVKLNVLFLR